LPVLQYLSASGKFLPFLQIFRLYLSFLLQILNGRTGCAFNRQKGEIMMKHATLALVLAATLAFGLVGCGRKDTGSDDMAGSNRPNSSMDNGTVTDNDNNGMTNNGTANGGTNSDTNNATNNPTTNNGTDGEGMLQGRSFQEMLDNGRITDDDGNLLNDRPSTHR
jgi:hypothetical protein